MQRHTLHSEDTFLCDIPGRKKRRTAATSRSPLPQVEQRNMAHFDQQVTQSGRYRGTVQDDIAPPVRFNSSRTHRPQTPNEGYRTGGSQSIPISEFTEEFNSWFHRLSVFRMTTAERVMNQLEAGFANPRAANRAHTVGGPSFIFWLLDSTLFAAKHLHLSVNTDLPLMGVPVENLCSGDTLRIRTSLTCRSQSGTMRACCIER